METCGEDGIRRIVTAFYRRVTADDLLGPLYPADQIGAAEERLADFLLFRLGARPAAIRSCGCATSASASAWPSATAAREFLDRYFAQVADFMRNQPSGA